MFKNIFAIILFAGMLTTVAVTQADTDNKYQGFASVLYK